MSIPETEYLERFLLPTLSVNQEVESTSDKKWP